jgi:DNA-binding MarR family transcriptional regulator
MSEGKAPTGSAEPAVRWLTDDEMETWRALSLLLAKLPAALGDQLQCDSRLSFVEYYVLAGLSDQPDRTLRMSRLAVLANSELSRLSHMVARLEKRGLVRREPDPTDRRFTNAVLTADGHRCLVEAAPAHVVLVRSLVFDALDVNAQHALRDAAAQILAHLEGSC